MTKKIGRANMLCTEQLNATCTVNMDMKWHEIFEGFPTWLSPTDLDKGMGGESLAGLQPSMIRFQHRWWTWASAPGQEVLQRWWRMIRWRSSGIFRYKQTNKWWWTSQASWLSTIEQKIEIGHNNNIMKLEKKQISQYSWRECGMSRY